MIAATMAAAPFAAIGRVTGAGLCRSKKCSRSRRKTTFVVPPRKGKLFSLTFRRIRKASTRHGTRCLPPGAGFLLTDISCHSGSKVASIRIKRADRCLLLKVEDAGNGISPEKLLEIQSHGTGVGILRGPVSIKFSMYLERKTAPVRLLTLAELRRDFIGAINLLNKRPPSPISIL